VDFRETRGALAVVGEWVFVCHRIPCGVTKKTTADAKANRPKPLTSDTVQLLAKAYRQIATKAADIISAVQIGATRKIISVSLLPIRSRRARERL